MLVDTNFNANNINWLNVGGTNFHSTQNTMFPGSNNQIFGNNIANTSPSVRSSLVTVMRSADTLLASLNSMRGGRNANSTFGLTQATSSDNDILGIRSVDANRLRNANVSSLSVDVLQVATAQRNEGTALNATDLATDSGFTTGNNHIAINIGGSQFDINFNVSATDTNRDVQQRIANAVNGRNLGIEASVDFNSTAGTSALVFQSATTGENIAGQPNFTVTSNAGNALAVTGVDTVTQEAQNAQFRVNRGGFTGALQTSRSNDVDLGFGIAAQLRDTGNVQVTPTRDTIGQINDFRHMVNSFNDLVEAARDGAGGSRLERDLSRVARSFSASLDRIGITINREGFMDINEDRMRAAAERGDLERFARDSTSSNLGFVNRLAQTASDVRRNPGAFVDNELTTNNDPMSWLLRSSPSGFARMNQFMNVGMLFDAWM